MGMFDEFKFDPNDVSVATSEGYTSAPMQLAYQGSGMMATGLGKLAGFKDEEDLFKEIYENAEMVALFCFTSKDALPVSTAFALPVSTAFVV